MSAASTLSLKSSGLRQEPATICSLRASCQFMCRTISRGDRSVSTCTGTSCAVVPLAQTFTRLPKTSKTCTTRPLQAKISACNASSMPSKKSHSRKPTASSTSRTGKPRATAATEAKPPKLGGCGRGAVSSPGWFGRRGRKRKPAEIAWLRALEAANCSAGTTAFSSRPPAGKIMIMPCRRAMSPRGSTFKPPGAGTARSKPTGRGATNMSLESAKPRVMLHEHVEPPPQSPKLCTSW
mmetsp:Transcript_124244/g.397731  ORF Transcript_124244/g.397731 Transcript_124244/m.397731 type:complete len:238 (-) Transcript_124244:36-749(-)